MYKWAKVAPEKCGHTQHACPLQKMSISERVIAMKKFTPHGFDSSVIDKSQLGTVPDSHIAKELGVRSNIICYWRTKWGIPSYEENRDRERQEMFDKGFHWCSKCAQYKSVGEFNKNNRNRFGLKTHCNDCRKQYRDRNPEYHRKRRQEYYKEKKDEIQARNAKWREDNIERVRQRAKERHAKLKAWANQLFYNCCARCGYDEFQSGLEFHHVIPDEKENTPTNVIASGDKKKIRYELDKCIMLCRNCHMAFHADEWQADFERREGIGWKIKK